MLKYLLLIIFSICISHGYSQNISIDVVNSTGKYVQGSFGSLEYSLGEIAITTEQTAAFTITQGFLQTDDMRTNIYVDDTAAGANNGTSWSDAFTDLQDALALGDDYTIHIAEGIYYPTTETLRGKAFEIPNRTTLLGGYPNGGGTRDWNNNITILSGDIDGGGNGGHSYHVVKVVNSVDVVLDGLHIKDGNANDGNSFGRARGGGIFCNGSTLHIINSTIRRNQAIYGGGIFATLSPSVIIENSYIKLNEAEFGSALYHSNETNMYIKSSRIIDNHSSVRCAIEVNNSSFTLIEQSIIANNTAANANAIGLVATNRNQGFTLLNSTVIGGIKNHSLFSMQVGYGDNLNVEISNSILAHQNTNWDKNIVVFNNNILNFETNNSYFAGASFMNLNGNGINNINEVATLFEDTVGDLLLNSDLSVNPCSPVVDAGDDAIVARLSSPNSDIAGNNRLFNTIDIGAYEVQTSCEVAAKLPYPNSTKVGGQFNLTNIYPNPSLDILNLDYVLEEPIGFTLMVINSNGKSLQEYSIQAQSKGFHTKSLDVSQLEKGFYVLAIQAGETQVFEKFIKM